MTEEDTYAPVREPWETDLSVRTEDRRDQKAARKKQAAMDSCMRDLLRSAGGRDYLWNLLARCHIFETTFSSEPFKAAFAEGERNIGLYILADIMRLDPKAYVKMMEEANASQSTSTEHDVSGEES